MLSKVNPTPPETSISSILPLYTKECKLLLELSVIYKTLLLEIIISLIGEVKVKISPPVLPSFIGLNVNLRKPKSSIIIRLSEESNCIFLGFCKIVLSPSVSVLGGVYPAGTVLPPRIEYIIFVTGST